jgi:hypothetical protein
VLSVSPTGLVEVRCDGPRDAVCSGRLVSGADHLASAPETTIGGEDSVVLEMSLTAAGRTLLAGASNRLPALLETTVVASDGTVCRVTSPAILVLERPANDLAARRRRRARKKKRAAAAPGHHAH